MERLLRSTFESLVTRGSLEVIFASGARLTAGDGTGRPVAIRFADRRAQWAFALDPELRMGELFTDGRLQVEQGSIYDFFVLLMENAKGKPEVPSLVDRVRFRLRRYKQRNDRRRALRNVAHHYDLDAGLYDLFLDADRQYSCAYFEHPGQDLEEAQRAKRRHIAAKLCLRPGQAVLDIGCGWGGTALYLADVARAGRVLGITLSQEQIRIAQERARQRQLEERVHFRLADYREIEGPFHRIVSVGMFEHVGLPYYDTFFRKCGDLLADDGVMLLHTIGVSGPPAHADPWIDKYIFPGGYVPALSEVLSAIERAGLIVCDVEVLRLHYAWTLSAWRERFLARRAEAVALYDERFCRMWEYFLAFCEAAFRHESLVVFQVQIAKRNDVVPITRGYLSDAETELARVDATPSGTGVA